MTVRYALTSASTEPQALASSLPLCPPKETRTSPLRARSRSACRATGLASSDCRPPHLGTQPPPGETKARVYSFAPVSSAPLRRSIEGLSEVSTYGEKRAGFTVGAGLGRCVGVRPGSPGSARPSWPVCEEGAGRGPPGLRWTPDEQPANSATAIVTAVAAVTVRIGRRLGRAAGAPAGFVIVELHPSYRDEVVRCMESCGMRCEAAPRSATANPAPPSNDCFSASR